MKDILPLSDKVAIGLSTLCLLHCFASPLLLVLLPSVAALPLEGEVFHLWMVVFAIPASVFALSVGCKQHKKYQMLVLGAVGLVCLIAAVALGEQVGEAGEKLLTAVGAVILIYGHYRNYRLCQKQTVCECS